VNRSAQEHLSYIQEKVNPVLEALVTAVLLERPDDPPFFMLKWLCEQTKSLDTADQGQRTSSKAEEIEAVRTEIARLKERKTQLMALRSGKGEDATNENRAEPPAADVKSDKSTKAEGEEDKKKRRKRMTMMLLMSHHHCRRT